jgi:hypothetical protein
MTYIRASEIGCALDCDLRNGRNKYTGDAATDDGPRINAAMAGATADNPITLIIDGSALISGLFLPAGGYWNIAGLGCGTGFFVKTGTAFSWALLLAIRKSFSLFRNSLDGWGLSNGKERRVFVLGTSERTEVALRFLHDQRIACAGLIDTNGGADFGRWVWGILVIGGLKDLSRLGSNHGVTEIVLPENESLPYSDMEFRAHCQHARLRLTKLGLYSVEADSRGDSNDGRTEGLPTTIPIRQGPNGNRFLAQGESI